MAMLKHRLESLSAGRGVAPLESEWRRITRAMWGLLLDHWDDTLFSVLWIYRVRVRDLERWWVRWFGSRPEDIPS